MTDYDNENRLLLMQFSNATLSAYTYAGDTPHHGGWRALCEEAGEAPAEDASVREKIVYKLRTAVGQAIYRGRKCTVEPVIGNPQGFGFTRGIWVHNEAMGFRQFSVRGQDAVTGEGNLV